MLSRIVVGLSCVAAISGCSSPVTVATFNIRMFPEQTTDRKRVAQGVAELQASVIAVQEVRSSDEMEALLDEVSDRTGRDYQLLRGSCGGDGRRITNAVAFDAEQWELVEHVDYPDLEPDGACVRQPGTLGVLKDREGRTLSVLSVHLQPFPKGFDERREQWDRLLARLDEIERRHDAPVLALGDYNTTGFTGEPPLERPFVEDVVARAGYSLTTAALPCSEYWRPPGDRGPYRPSILDHIVATRGRWEPAEVRGMCARLDCEPTDPEDMDPDFFSVSDHCPVVLRGQP